MRYVGLIDCNNFFASCERLFRPDLQGRPVLVLSSNDGCVVARSQEVKDIGIPMGVPYFEIKDIVKDKAITVFSSNFTLYRDISARVFSVVKGLVREFEQYSIDEGFFYVDEARAEYLGQQIRDTILREVGIPVSVGIAASKTLAKVAARHAKRQAGVFVLSPMAWREMRARVGLGELWGVGRGRMRAFAQYGLSSVADYLRCEVSWVRRQFGVEGERLYRELSGEEAYLLSEHPLPKTITSSRSFRKATTDRGVVHDAIAYHIRQAVYRLRRHGLTAGRLVVSARSSRFAKRRGGFVAEATFPVPVSDVITLVKAATCLVEAHFCPRVAYQKAGIVLTGIQPHGAVTPSLFKDSEADRNTVIAQTLDRVATRWGDDVLVAGSRLRTAAWAARRDVLSPAYTTRWSDLPVASAR